jgi:hypothetical protein
VALAVALLVGTALAVVGCGLPQDSRARPVASNDIPPGLLGPTTTLDVTSNGRGPSRHLYFLDDEAGHLVGVERAMADDDLATPLTAVIAGPPRTLRSDIPPLTKLIDVSLDGSVLTVVLSEDIIKVNGSAQANAFAQLVWTATDIPGVTGVKFFFADADGKRQEVKPLTDVGSEAVLLDRSDYQKIQPTTTTTTAPLPPTTGS